MPITDDHGPKWYKEHDPQGVTGFWLDLMLEVTIMSMLIGVPIIGYQVVKELIRLVMP